MKKLMMLLLFGLLYGPAYTQTFQLTNSTLQDLSVNYPLNDTVLFVFSEPLDTNHDFNSENNDNGMNSPIYFLKLSYYPYSENHSLISNYWLSDTKDSLYVVLDLEPTAVYQLRFIDGYSTIGSRLQPIQYTFTHNAVLPSGSISGKVNGISEEPNKIVFLINSDAKFPDAIDQGPNYSVRYAPINNDGSFTVPNVEDGTYFVFAFQHVENLPEQYPLDGNIGFYDALNDGFADTITVQSGNSISNINFSMKEFSLSGTSASMQSAVQLAGEFFPDAQLVAIRNSNQADTLGRDYIWSYYFKVDDGTKILAVNYSGSMPVINFFSNDENVSFLLNADPINPNSKSSDELFPLAFQDYKDSGYYENYPEVRIKGFLVGGLPIDISTKVNSEIKSESKHQRNFKSLFSGKFDFGQNKISASSSFWIIEFRAKNEWGDYDYVTENYYNASTGEIVDFGPTTAKKAYKSMKDTFDADVLFVGSDVDENGKSDMWGGVLSDKTDHSIFLAFAVGGYAFKAPIEILPLEIADIGFVRNPISGEWIDSDSIIHVMDSLYSDRHEINPDYADKVLFLYNENRIIPKDTSLYWTGNYDVQWIPVGKSSDEKNKLSSFAKWMKNEKMKFGFSVANKNEKQISKTGKMNDDGYHETFIINARNGEEKFDSTISALSHVQDAINYAKTHWSLQAQLYGISSLYPVENDGKSVAWTYDFMRPTTNNSYRVYFSADEMLTELNLVPETLPVQNLPLSDFNIDSDSLARLHFDSPYGFKQVFLNLSEMNVNGNNDPVWHIIGVEENNDDYENNDQQKISGVNPSYYLWQEDSGLLHFYLSAKTAEFYDANKLGFTEAEGIRSAFSFTPLDVSLKLKALFTNNVDSLGQSNLWFYVFLNSLLNSVMVRPVSGTAALKVSFNVLNEGDHLFISQAKELTGWNLNSSQTAAKVVERVQTDPPPFEPQNVFAVLGVGPFSPFFENPELMDENTPYWNVTFENGSSEENQRKDYTVNAINGYFLKVDQLENHSKNFSLNQNYPNPFNPETEFLFSIPKSEHVSIKIFNLIGQEILTLLDENKSEGTYRVKVNAKNWSSGVYIYQIRAGNFVESKKMTVIK